MSALRTALLLSCAAACVDTQGRFDAYNERFEDYKKRLEAERDAGSEDAGDCTPATPELLEGRYLYAFAAAFDKTKPILMSLTLTAKKGSERELNATLQALSVGDLEPVGEELESTLVIDGARFTVDDVNLVVPGAANPLLPGTDATAEVVLTGKLCAPSEGQVTFVCGTGTGAITDPLEIPLEGSEFGAVRVDQGDPWPEPVSTCAMGKERS